MLPCRCKRWLLAFGTAVGLLRAGGLRAGELDFAAKKPFARITPEEVREALVDDLRVRGLVDEQLSRVEDIDLPVSLPALMGRRLRVSSRCWDGILRRTQFRLECGKPGQCLPFLVYVNRSKWGDAEAERAEASCGMSGAGGRVRRGALGKPILRAGDQATALFVGNGLRMTARVTCLQRGGEGELIRVRRKDGQIFRARISGSALVEVVPR